MGSEVTDKDKDILEALDALAPGPGRKSLAAAMIAPLARRMDYDSVGRSAFRAEPPCTSCGRTVEEGADAGCPECVARSVMES